MGNPTEGAPQVRVDLFIDPDGVNGDIEAVVSGDPAEVRVIVSRGPEGEVVFDNAPGPMCVDCGLPLEAYEGDWIHEYGQPEDGHTAFPPPEAEAV